MTKTLTEQAEKKELYGYYYAHVHQYDGECDEDHFVDIVHCDKYGVHYESCYDGWNSIIEKVPDYEDVCGMESQIKRLQEQLNEANELLKAYGTESLWESLSLSCDEANEYCKKWGVK